MTSQDYHQFLKSKALRDPATGMDSIPDLTSALFDHQSAIARWALRRGRAAVFAGTGLGKTLMELVWADAVARHTGKPVLMLAPLAVASQHVAEAKRFGLPAMQVAAFHDGVPVMVSNYQKIDRFDFSPFGGVVLDESSILKNVDGKTRNALVDACRQVPFRLAATATPAPNDYVELGNHAEFLGVMSMTDMLSMFFTHDGGETQKWRLKGHAADRFWQWMATWAVMLRKPSDIGFSDDGYQLPPLVEHEHLVKVAGAVYDGWFPAVAETLSERLAARRDSVAERVEKAVSLTPDDRPFVWWCHLNAESTALTQKISGAVEVRGSDRDSEKERKLTAFSNGEIRVLVTKPSIAGFGMNWQHCADTGFVGLSDSFEQIYQAIRRFWRFGQQNPVNAHFISSAAEGAVLANFRRKQRDADRMAEAMIAHMSDISKDEIMAMSRDLAVYTPQTDLCVPDWMGADA